MVFRIWFLVRGWCNETYFYLDDEYNVDEGSGAYAEENEFDSNSNPGSNFNSNSNQNNNNNNQNRNNQNNGFNEDYNNNGYNVNSNTNNGGSQNGGQDYNSQYNNNYNNYAPSTKAVSIWFSYLFLVIFLRIKGIILELLARCPYGIQNMVTIFWGSTLTLTVNSSLFQSLIHTATIRNTRTTLRLLYKKGF